VLWHLRERERREFAQTADRQWLFLLQRRGHKQMSLFGAVQPILSAMQLSRIPVSHSSSLNRQAVRLSWLLVAPSGRLYQLCPLTQTILQGL